MDCSYSFIKVLSAAANNHKEIPVSIYFLKNLLFAEFCSSHLLLKIVSEAKKALSNGSCSFIKTRFSGVKVNNLWKVRLTPVCKKTAIFEISLEWRIIFNRFQ